MKSLQTVTPTPEQLKIIKRVLPGIEIVRGAAGSGKTTTAILKLKLFISRILASRKRDESEEPVRVLVLTFNKTLRGYIEDIVRNNIPDGIVELVVDTFSHWAYQTLDQPEICSETILTDLCISASTEIGISSDFLIGEAQYVMGRFIPSELDNYLHCKRVGRGLAPRIGEPLRQQILDLIIHPFNALKHRQNVLDWNDAATRLAKKNLYNYDIVIVDEAQDFSANQLRAVIAQCSASGYVSIILDTAQRIYSGGYTWSEIGLNVRPENSHRLSVNYRNTPEIARLAASLVNNVVLDEDGTAPQLVAMNGNPSPIVLKGLFRAQVKWSIEYIKANVDFSKQSVAFLHPKGWFTYLEQCLRADGIEFVDLTRRTDWPHSDVNLALSTLHSAKGLDFDYCFIIGLSKISLPGGDFDHGDDRFDTACRLLSMAIGRARRQVILGYKPGEEPAIIHKIDSTCFNEIVL